jgi:hypothetical protein
VQGLVGQLLFQRQLLAAWFLRRHEDLDLRKRECQKTEILQQPTPRRQGIRGGLGNALIVHTPRIGRAEKKDCEQGIDEQDNFYRVVFFLAAITLGLFSRVLGADNAPFGLVMGKRGDTSTAGAATKGVGASSTAVTTVAASASETPSR